MSTLIVEDGNEFPALEDEIDVVRNVFLVVVERGLSGYSAYVPDLDGVVAAADSELEVRSLISEAVAFHVEGMREEGEQVPEPSSSAFWVAE